MMIVQVFCYILQGITLILLCDAIYRMHKTSKIMKETDEIIARIKQKLEEEEEEIHENRKKETDE